MAAVAEIGRDEMLERLFIDVRPCRFDRLRVAIVFDVHPADARLHRQVLLEHLGRPCSPGVMMLPASKISTQRRVIDLPMNLGHQICPVWPTRLASISRPKVRSLRWHVSAIWPS